MIELNPLGLSDASLAERKQRLHAGDATAIMSGDYRSVFARFQPDYVPEDLSREFRVQLGSYTEPFGAWWTERMTGREVHYCSDNPLMRHIWQALSGREAQAELFVSADYPFMACNLDSWTTIAGGHEAALDMKHVGRIGEAEMLRYTPAGVWQATVLGLDHWGIAPIVGNRWEPPIFQAVDVMYQAELIARARECWAYIEAGEEPPDLRPNLWPRRSRSQSSARSISTPRRMTNGRTGTANSPAGPHLCRNQRGFRPTRSDPREHQAAYS